jgi:hypothetical protein
MSPAIHLPLQHFQTVDLPCNWPRTPRQRAPRFHRLIIRPSSICEALERLETAGCGTLQPGLELVGVTLADEGGKGLGPRDGLSDRALLLLEPSALLLFFIVQLCLAPHDQPRGPPGGQRLVSLNDRRRGSRRAGFADAPLSRTKAADGVCDDAVLPPKALRLHLATQRKGTVTACVPTFEQVGFLGIEHRRVASPPRLACGKGRGLKRLVDRPTGASNMCCEGFQRPSLGIEGPNLFIFGHSSGPIVLDLLLGAGRGTRWCDGDRHGTVITGQPLVLCHWLSMCNVPMRSAEARLEGRRQVLQARQSVGDLGRLWSTLTHPCARGFCAVTGHHLDFGMGLEPRGTGCSRPILTQVDGTAAFEIHDDRAVAMAFAPRPIINANDMRRCPVGQRETPHAPQPRISAHRCTLTCQRSSPSGTSS